MRAAARRTTFLRPFSTSIGSLFFFPPSAPDYHASPEYDLQAMIPLDGLKVFEVALQVTENIAYYVPRNVNVDQLCSLAGPGGRVEVERNVLNGKTKTVTAYYGELVRENSSDNC